ncbi:hypothetical protein BKA93DRAFT_230678 [Sparassis latifolia]|uniref:Uncharacterized protein n=1 Tax=Sparassis crispa TaxID=139825 RepID=A0A401GFC0_9APHY|nr:hypothetical protein SCP_0305450 [Sparassis crispa]GBE80825.1 hypothetical protein SCP_0305450 [Sparassis crispa]
MVHVKRVELHMYVASVRGGKEESFEELRVEDYIHAYEKTGKPPAPCPQVPTDDAERATLGLPPLFKPRTVVPPEFPETHVFRPTADPYDKHNVFHSIVFQPDFCNWSFEELRCSAYADDKKYMPVPVVHKVSPAVIIDGEKNSDFLDCISSMPAYQKHSFEELRLAYIRYGRQLTSAEIFSRAQKRIRPA